MNNLIKKEFLEEDPIKQNEKELSDSNIPIVEEEGIKSDVSEYEEDGKAIKRGSLKK